MSMLRRALFGSLLLSLLFQLPLVPSAAAQEPASTQKLRGTLGDEIRDHPSRDQDVLVVLQPGSTETDVRQTRASVGRSGPGFHVIPAFADRLSPGQIRQLAADPRVRQVEINGRVQTTLDTARRWFGADAAQAAGYQGGDASSTYSTNDAVVAVLDTGIDSFSPYLNNGKVLAFVNCAHAVPVANPTCDAVSPLDDNGHGTHVAGIVAGADSAGTLNGVAPRAALVGIKALDNKGGGWDSDIVAAIDWAVSHKAQYSIDVLTMSLGGPCAPCDGQDATSLAVNQAHDAGIVVTVAAGNDGPSLRTVDSPGVATGAITVGAMADVTPNDGASPNAGFRLASFSSRGPTSDGRHKPDIAGPGVNIRSACSRGGSPNDLGCPRTAGSVSSDSIVLSGTSMATPFVAGTAALMLSAIPTLTPEQVRTALTATAVPWGADVDTTTPGRQSDDYGSGRLDVAAAVASVADPNPVPPAVPVHQFASGFLSGTGSKACFVVTSSAGYPVAATMTMAADTVLNDLDLYIRTSSGNPLVPAASSETSSRQEDTGSAAGLTSYQVIVSVFTGASAFDLDISNALTVGSCGPVGLRLTGFSVTDASANPAAAEPGFTNGDVRYAFSSTPLGQATQWMVTTTSSQPAADDPGWQPLSAPTASLTTEGSVPLYPWLRTFYGEVSSAADASAQTQTITVDRTPPAISGAVVPDADGYLRARERAGVTWSPASDTNLRELPISLFAPGATSALAGPFSNSTTSTTWKVPDTESPAFALRVVATDRAGNQGTSLAAPRYVMAPGGYWVDRAGAVHRLGSVPSVDESRRFSFNIGRSIAMRPGREGGYVLDGWGGIHAFAVGGGSTPAGVAGGPYWPGWDIARDIVLRPGGGAYVLDGFGGIHSVGGAPAAKATGYWGGWDIARRLVMLPDGSGGYVLDGFGGLHPFSTGSNPLPPKSSAGPYFGFDIARGVELLPGGTTGYLLDGFGGVHPVAFGGAPVPPRSTVTGYWSGWDIARGLIVTPDNSGGTVLEGFGGSHLWSISGAPAPPAMASSFYAPVDGAVRAAVR